jgi:hypothetical protein
MGGRGWKGCTKEQRMEEDRIMETVKKGRGEEGGR